MTRPSPSSSDGDAEDQVVGRQRPVEQRAPDADPVPHATQRQRPLVRSGRPAPGSRGRRTADRRRYAGCRHPRRRGSNGDTWFKSVRRAATRPDIRRVSPEVYGGRTSRGLPDDFLPRGRGSAESARLSGIIAPDEQVRIFSLPGDGDPASPDALRDMRTHLAYRPGQASTVLTKHYLRMHPDALAETSHSRR